MNCLAARHTDILWSTQNSRKLCKHYVVCARFTKLPQFHFVSVMVLHCPDKWAAILFLSVLIEL